VRSARLTPFVLLLACACGNGVSCDGTGSGALQDPCWEPVPDSTTPSTFTGIEGSVYQSGTCSTALCTTVGQGRVLVYPAGSATAIEDQYFYGSFRIALTPGSYDVVVAFAGATADRSVQGVTVAEGAGLRIVRSYWADYDARLLALFFAPGTHPQSYIVLGQLGLSEIDLTIPTTTFPEVRVSLPYRGHPEIIGERALAEFPGVVTDYQLDPLCGAGSWVPASGDGHFDDWD